MKHATLFFLFTALAFSNTGCLTRTYVAGSEVSTDQNLRLLFTGHGAYAHAYTDKTRKLVDIDIESAKPPFTNLFHHRYKIVGADVSADVRWASPDKVAIELYDFGDGLTRSDANSRSNRLATMSLHLDQRSGKFVEDTP